MVHFGPTSKKLCFSLKIVHEFGVPAHHKAVKIILVNLLLVFLKSASFWMQSTTAKQVYQKETFHG
jgi:hypothetical protein